MRDTVAFTNSDQINPTDPPLLRDCSKITCRAIRFHKGQCVFTEAAIFSCCTAVTFSIFYRSSHFQRSIQSRGGIARRDSLGMQPRSSVYVLLDQAEMMPFHHQQTGISHWANIPDICNTFTRVTRFHLSVPFGLASLQWKVRETSNLEKIFPLVHIIDIIFFVGRVKGQGYVAPEFFEVLNGLHTFGK